MGVSPEDGSSQATWADARNQAFYKRLLKALRDAEPDDGIGNQEIEPTLEDLAFHLVYLTAFIGTRVPDAVPLLLKPAFEKSISPTEAVPGLTLAFALRVIAEEHANDPWIMEGAVAVIESLTRIEASLRYLFRSSLA